MSTFSGKLRKCDSFGAGYSFNYKGEDTFGTLGGGIATICLSIGILTYMCIRTIGMVCYEDPEISSYVIMENRSHMTEPYSM